MTELYTVEVIKKKKITEQKAMVELERPPAYYFKAGQHLEVYMNGDSRPYSIASSPDEKKIRLYVKAFEDGEFAKNLISAGEDEKVQISEPQGGYVYTGEEEVLLLSTGMGAAPNLSIARHISHTWNDASCGFVSIFENEEEAIRDRGFTIYSDSDKEEDPADVMLDQISDRYDAIYYCGDSGLGDQVEEKAKKLGVAFNGVKY